MHESREHKASRLAGVHGGLQVAATESVEFEIDIFVSFGGNVNIISADHVEKLKKPHLLKLRFIGGNKQGDKSLRVVVHALSGGFQHPACGRSFLAGSLGEGVLHLHAN